MAVCRDFDFPKSKTTCRTKESPTPGYVIFSLCPKFLGGNPE